MMNKKGALVLRDIIFMMMIMSSILVLAGYFVGDMAVNYENTNMSNEWAISGINTSSNTLFADTANNVSDAGKDLEADTGILAFLGGGLKGIGTTLFMILSAPSTIANFIAGVIQYAGAPAAIVLFVKILMNTLLWGVVLFTIISAFTPGGGRF